MSDTPNQPDLPDTLRRCICADISVSFEKPTERGTHLRVRCVWESYAWTRNFTINPDSPADIVRALTDVIDKVRQIEATRMATISGWERDHGFRTSPAA